MHKLLRTVPALLCGVTLLTAARQTDQLDRAVAAWAKVRTARASFQQTIVNPLTGRTFESSGEYQQQRPGKLSVRFNDPVADRIVADGKYVWLYLPSSAPGQVIRTPAAATGTGTVDLSAQFLSDPRAKYTVSALGAQTIGGRPMHRYSLVPKSVEAPPFKKAVVDIDDGDATIRQFTVTERSGLERTVRLTAIRTNVAVDPAAFTFTVPAGVRVVAH